MIITIYNVLATPGQHRLFESVELDFGAT